MRSLSLNLETGLLFESPFTNVNDQGLLGVFGEAASTRIIQSIERINGNAGTG
jgi:type I restriction enzyme, R subunit